MVVEATRIIQLTLNSESKTSKGIIRYTTEVKDGDMVSKNSIRARN